MTITPEIKNTVKKIYSSLSKAFKEDIYEKKLEYTEKEIPLTISHTAVNERLHMTRMQKINGFKDLVDNWAAFKEVYKDDPILDKIGMEIMSEKMFFNEQIINTIKEYPQRNQVLYYFNKNQPVNLPDLKEEDYDRFKNIVLHDIGFSARKKMIYRNLLVKSLDQLIEDKTHEQSQYLSSLAQGTPRHGKVSCEANEILSTIKKHILSGDFVATQKNGEYTVEIPLAGIKTNNDTVTNYKTTVLRIEPEYLRNFTISVGGIEELGVTQEKKLNTSLPALADKISTLRNDSYQPKEQNNNRPNLAVI